MIIPYTNAMSRLISILISILVVIPSIAQSPGGVSGYEAWFATSPIGNDHNGAYHWEELSGDSVLLRYVGGSTAGTEVTEPRSSIQSFNFHPALRFSASSGFMDAVLRHGGLAEATFVGVFVSDSLPSTDTRLYAVMGKDASAMTRDKVLHSGETTALDYSPDLLHGQQSTTAMKVAVWQRALKPRYSPWGEPSATMSLGGGTLSGNPAFTTTVNGLGTTPGLSGFCPELIVYGRRLTPYERVNVESYLAMKYGITLTGSYYSGERMLWDTDEGSWQRVTGIISDSCWSFRQSLSTTSYEEAPRVSSLSANDSFFGRDSYSKASENRLLAMGRIFSHDIPDGSYLMWGDNGLSTQTSIGGRNWHVMGRKWFVRTDIDTVSVASPETTYSGLTLTADGNVLSMSAQSSGTPYLQIGPKTSSDLHYGFTCPAGNACFFIGTGGVESTDSNDGYFFDNGKVYKVVANVQEQQPFLTDAKGHDIDIYKWGDHLFMQIDGLGDASYNIRVLLMDPSPNIPMDSGTVRDDPPVSPPEFGRLKWPGYSCYGLIKPSAGTILPNVRIDGFNDTGTYAELSYDIAGNGEFKPYRLGRSYLLACGGGATRAYRCTGFDPERKKILFHNLELTDRDTISFAWNDGLLADVDAEEASCNTPNGDGKINIHIHNTGPGLSYLVSDSPNWSGTGMPYPESQRDYTISGKQPGVYYVTLFQRAMSNLRAWSASDSEYMTASLPSGTNDISWYYDGSGNEYTAGIRVSGSIVKYGVKLRNDTAWFVRNGAISSPRRLLKGDSIHVRYASGKVYVKINTSQVSNSATKTSSWLFRANFGRGQNTFQDLSGIGNSPTLSSDRVMLESIKADTLRYEVHIGSSCNGQTYVVPLNGEDGFAYHAPTQPDGSSGEADDAFLATTDPANPLAVTAVLSPNNAIGPVQMLVFDISGRLHHKGRVMNSPPYSETFSVNAPGIYVIKAVTGNGEHTVKVACGL